MQNALPLRLQKDPYTRRNLPLRLHIEGRRIEGDSAKSHCAGIFGHIFVAAPQLACMAVRMSARVMRGVRYAWMCVTSDVRCSRVMCY